MLFRIVTGSITAAQFRHIPSPRKETVLVGGRSPSPAAGDHAATSCPRGRAVSGIARRAALRAGFSPGVPREGSGKWGLGEGGLSPPGCLRAGRHQRSLERAGPQDSTLGFSAGAFSQSPLRGGRRAGSQALPVNKAGGRGPLQGRVWARGGDSLAEVLWLPLPIVHPDRNAKRKLKFARFLFPLSSGS